MHCHLEDKMGLAATIKKKKNQRFLNKFGRKKTPIWEKINSWRIGLEYKEHFIYLFLLLSAFLKKK